ncbi:PDZ/DHR/GLGF domain protein [Gemmatirosa kalamazoonensis]|uniref:PDZ/DHR/GLGF domain protein n=1 Tax=Gemmatirosa kalamazoonensis TaxID=861299 RepID=W0RJR3_9BACT|nr:PDZ domain-containing protein [Gemmatirosa kalamazoonensis]AHG89653.1 PDZ/DHR/GLGF domain protein [Gemmatirosa kalamazoonensis]
MRTSKRILIWSVAIAAGAGVVPTPGAAQATTMTAACERAGMMLHPRRTAPVAADTLMANVRRLLETQEVIAARAGSTPPAAAQQRMRLTFSRGWLGVFTSEIREERLASDGLHVRYCDYPVVVSVEPASPAQRAGLEAGDTIVAYNDIDLREAEEIALDRLLVPDTTVRVTVRRDGRPLVLPLVVGRRPSTAIARVFTQGGTGAGGTGTGFSYVVVSPGQPGAPGVALPRVPEAPPVATRLRTARRTPNGESEANVVTGAPLAMTPFVLGFGGSGPSAVAGAQLMAMDDDLRAVVGAKSGVLVLRVAEGTPASEAGLRSGDVILLADGVAATTPLVVQRALLRSRDDRAVPLKVERKGKTREVILRW